MLFPEGFDMEEMLQLITDKEMRSQIERVVPFHGYLSTGAFIGIQMFNLARRILGISEGERIFVTCETYNCLPDPFQVLAGATIGNKGLKIEQKRRGGIQNRGGARHAGSG